jgi:hypothetical protein
LEHYRSTNRGVPSVDPNDASTPQPSVPNSPGKSASGPLTRKRVEMQKSILVMVGVSKVVPGTTSTYVSKVHAPSTQYESNPFMPPRVATEGRTMGTSACIPHQVGQDDEAHRRGQRGTDSHEDLTNGRFAIQP